MELDLADDDADDTWRCLERLAGLLERHEAAVIELLDQGIHRRRGSTRTSGRGLASNVP